MSTIQYFGVGYTANGPSYGKATVYTWSDVRSVQNRTCVVAYLDDLDSAGRPRTVEFDPETLESL